MSSLLQPTNLLLAFLENVCHPALKTVGVDMDKIQAKVYETVPDPTFAQQALTMVVGTIFWMFLHKGTDRFLVRPFMHNFRKQFPSTEHWHKFDEKMKIWYASYWFGIIHALFSTVQAGYCFIYADGKPGTTWFNSKEYQLTMFPIQKWANCFEIGYIIWDLIYCVSQADDPGFELYAHHGLSIAGQITSLISGGIWGSMCNLTWFSEASTPFVNGRQILAWHEQTSSTLYVVNGLTMTWSFFVVRVVYYSYMIFYISSWYVFQEPNFWQLYYPDMLKRYCGIFSLVLFTLMYFIQCFWFYKIMMGLLKAVGCIKKKNKTAKKAE